MPKVLRILNRLVVGGPALHVLNLTHYMSPEFETVIVAGNKDDHEQGAEYLTDKHQIKPIYISEMTRSINFLNDFIAYRKIRKIIKDFKPDIVDTHGAKSGAIGRMAASSMGVPVIIHTYHGHIFHSYFNKIKTWLFIIFERYLARQTDVIIAISEIQKKELLSDFKIAAEKKFHVVPLGIDLNKFQNNYLQKRNHFRTEFGLDENEIGIGIVGRLVPIKNHHLFLEAIAYLLKKSTKKIKAFIIGDGLIKKNLELKAKALGIPYTTALNIDYDPYTLIFTSWRNDIDFVNAGLDIITLTSFNEGTPLSLIEAQASNKPIVTTDVGGIRDVVGENETALLSQIGDNLVFMNNLLNLVEDDNLRFKLGGNGFKYVEYKYNYERLVKDTSELYKNLLLKKAKS